PSWAESACTGKRKAVIIGINYTLGAAPLRGCHSDADRMRKFIIQRYGFDSDDIRLFKDDPRLKQYQQPTKENIIKALEWLVDGAKTDDSLFFFFSGHGGQMYDIDGDEPDAMDECIYPVDAATAGPILDDHLHKILVRPLPRGTRLTAIFDSCHSGSALDLPFFYSASQQMRDPRILDVGQGTVVRIASNMRHDDDKDNRVSGDDDFHGLGNTDCGLRRWRVQGGGAGIIMLSGCKDSQFSFDAMVDNRYTGALSWAFTSTLDDYPQITYGQLLNQGLKKKGYNQRPQLSTSHPMDLGVYLPLIGTLDSTERKCAQDLVFIA
ncbi:peptidase C14, caspase domain-containing protein, partial [Infundibulicybe gibba]